MKILAVDDEPFALSDLVKQIERAIPESEIRSYLDPDRALKEIERDGFKPHICFLDIEMFGTSGLLLAKRIKEFAPYANIIFTTGHTQYALDAFHLQASGYLLKPISAESIAREIRALRHPVERSSGKEVSVRTFGNFEAFVRGEKIRWHRNRTKELFAYLIDREGEAEIKQVKNTLFEDELFSNKLDGHIQVIVSDLKKTLDSYGTENILMRSRGILRLDREKIDCDYWSFLAADTFAVDAYQGVYMEDYAWAIMTENRLNRRR